MTHPPTNTLAPHSCGDICSRKRHTCSHSCPLPCHPGPCPPCQVALVVPCPSHNYPLTVKCHMSSNQSTSMTPVCGIDCERVLSCGNKDHLCDGPCHYGPCKPCEVVEVVKCYCGKHSKEVPCGWNKDKELLSARPSEGEIGEVDEWKGRYDCGESCDRFFDCGIHPCKEVSVFCNNFLNSTWLTATDLPPSLTRAARLPLLSSQDHTLPVRYHLAQGPAWLPSVRLRHARPDVQLSMPQGSPLWTHVPAHMPRGTLSTLSRRGGQALSVWREPACRWVRRAEGEEGARAR